MQRLLIPHYPSCRWRSPLIIYKCASGHTMPHSPISHVFDPPGVVLASILEERLQREVELPTPIPSRPARGRPRGQISSDDIQILLWHDTGKQGIIFLYPLNLHVEPRANNSSQKASLPVARSKQYAVISKEAGGGYPILDGRVSNPSLISFRLLHSSQFGHVVRDTRDSAPERVNMYTYSC